MRYIRVLLVLLIVLCCGVGCKRPNEPAPTVDPAKKAEPPADQPDQPNKVEPPADPQKKRVAA